MKHIIGLKTLALSLGLVMVTTACAGVSATPQDEAMSQKAMPQKLMPNKSMKDHKFVKKGDMSKDKMKAMMAKCKGKMVEEVTVIKDKDGKETKKVMMKCIMKGKGGKMGDMKNNPKMQKMKKMHMMMAGADCKKTEEIVKGEDGKENKKITVKCEMKKGGEHAANHEKHMKDGTHEKHMKEAKSKGKMKKMMKRPDGKPADAVKGFHDALEAGDGDKVLSFLHDDVIIFEGGHINPSKENYRTTHLPGDMKGAQARKGNSRIVDQNVTMTMHTATVMTSTETKGERDGKAYTRHGTETMVLSSNNGKWLITHIHWSGRTVTPKK
jgi:ketosteroid isomerase-like protein